MIARAKRIDSDEVVEGYVKPIGNGRFEILTHRKINNNDAYVINEIDPSTLQYSFDGVSFYSEEFIKELLEDAKHLRSCEEQCEIYGL